MNAIPVIFAKGYHPISLGIRLITWSSWSHCAIIHYGRLEWAGQVYDGEKVIEALGGVGVVVTPMADFVARYLDYDVCMLAVIDSPEAAYERVIREIGKPYDKRALYSIPLQAVCSIPPLNLVSMALRIRDWNDPAAWFCSELLAHASGIYRQSLMSRITPTRIYDNCPEVHCVSIRGGQMFYPELS